VRSGPLATSSINNDFGPVDRKDGCETSSCCCFSTANSSNSSLADSYPLWFGCRHGR